MTFDAQARRQSPSPRSANLMLAQIVEVAAFGVQDLAEDALPDHVEDHHLRTVVVAVLHHHAVLLVFLRVLDELPAIIEGHGRRHFGRGMLAVLHGGDAHRDVPFPRRGGEDEVDVLGLAQPLEVARAPAVAGRFLLPCRDDQLLHELHALLGNVADRSHAHARDRQHVADVRAALSADADKADADLRDRRRRETRRQCSRSLWRDRRRSLRAGPGYRGPNDGAGDLQKRAAIGVRAVRVRHGMAPE